MSTIDSRRCGMGVKLFGVSRFGGETRVVTSDDVISRGQKTKKHNFGFLERRGGGSSQLDGRLCFRLAAPFYCVRPRSHKSLTVQHSTICPTGEKRGGVHRWKAALSSRCSILLRLPQVTQESYRAALNMSHWKEKVGGVHS